MAKDIPNSSGGHFVGLKLAIPLYERVREAAVADWRDGKTGFPSTAEACRTLIIAGFKYREIERTQLARELAESETNGDGQ